MLRVFLELVAVVIAFGFGYYIGYIDGVQNCFAEFKRTMTAVDMPKQFSEYLKSKYNEGKSRLRLIK